MVAIIIKYLECFFKTLSPLIIGVEKFCCYIHIPCLVFSPLFFVLLVIATVSPSIENVYSYLFLPTMSTINCSAVSNNATPCNVPTNRLYKQHRDCSRQKSPRKATSSQYNGSIPPTRIPAPFSPTPSSVMQSTAAKSTYPTKHSTKKTRDKKPTQEPYVQRRRRRKRRRRDEPLPLRPRTDQNKLGNINIQQEWGQKNKQLTFMRSPSGDGSVTTVKSMKSSSLALSPPRTTCTAGNRQEHQRVIQSHHTSPRPAPTKRCYTV